MPISSIGWGPRAVRTFLGVCMGRSTWGSGRFADRSGSNHIRIDALCVQHRSVEMSNLDDHDILCFEVFIDLRIEVDELRIGFDGSQLCWPE